MSSFTFPLKLFPTNLYISEMFLIFYLAWKCVVQENLIKKDAYLALSMFQTNKTSVKYMEGRIWFILVLAFDYWQTTIICK